MPGVCGKTDPSWESCEQACLKAEGCMGDLSSPRPKGGISHHPEHILISWPCVVGNKKLEDTLLHPHLLSSPPLTTSGAKVQVETCLVGLPRHQGHLLPAPAAAWQGGVGMSMQGPWEPEALAAPSMGPLGETGDWWGTCTDWGRSPSPPGPASSRECGHTPALSSGSAPIPSLAALCARASTQRVGMSCLVSGQR